MVGCTYTSIYFLFVGFVITTIITTIVFLEIRDLGSSKSKLSDQDVSQKLRNRVEIRNISTTKTLTILKRIKVSMRHDESVLQAVRAQCQHLNKDIFLICKPNLPMFEYDSLQPCTRETHLAKIEDAYVSDNSVHRDVPGTIFTKNIWLRQQEYVRPVPFGDPIAWGKGIKVLSIDKCLGTALQAYPLAMGHFPHETLPRILFLLNNIPEHCKVLVATSPFVNRYIRLLPHKFRNRILPWKGTGNVYFSSAIYFTYESPYCLSNNPHRGGMSTYFHPSIVQQVRQHYTHSYKVTENVTLVINRNGSRSYFQHTDLLAKLRNHGHNVAIFNAEGTLAEHIELFHKANIVIGPHGAGFSNLIFCRSRTFVIEIGWNKPAPMEMDNMYFRLSMALNLNYRLLIGKGSYDGSIDLPACRVIRLLPRFTLLRNRRSLQTPLRVISYSLYGSNGRYIKGALENAILAPYFYPQWQIRMYHDNSVPNHILNKLREAHVNLVNITGTNLENSNKMNWRVAVAYDKRVERFVVRDVDSRLGLRERVAVEEWLESGKEFHVMRDHPSHADDPIGGGLWGAMNAALHDVLPSLAGNHDEKYMSDMNWLKKIVWPKAQHSVMQHDSFSCMVYTGSRPWPIARVGVEHVGGVVIGHKLRQGDVEMLKHAAQPNACKDKPNFQLIRKVKNDICYLNFDFAVRPEERHGIFWLFSGLIFFFIKFCYHTKRCRRILLVQKKRKF